VTAPAQAPAARPAAPGRRGGFGHLVLAELTKIRTVRSTVWSFLLLVVLTIFDLLPVIAGLGLIAFAITLVVLLAVRTLAPSLHTVEHNPMQDLMKTPGKALMFAGLVVVAGGVREELQRAFLLRRFERSLGGASVGIIVTSLAFGAGHIVQGVDAVIATALLGAFWGIVYLRRRSVVAPMVSHSGFDLLQVLQFMATGL